MIGIIKITDKEGRDKYKTVFGSQPLKTDGFTFIICVPLHDVLSLGRVPSAATVVILVLVQIVLVLLILVLVLLILTLLILILIVLILIVLILVLVLIVVLHNKHSFLILGTCLLCLASISFMHGNVRCLPGQMIQHGIQKGDEAADGNGTHSGGDPPQPRIFHLEEELCHAATRRYGKKHARCINAYAKTLLQPLGCPL